MMLAMKNLLREIVCFFKNTSKKALQNGAILASGFSLVLLVSSNGQGKECAGKRREAMECETVAMAGEVVEAFCLEPDLAEQVRKENQAYAQKGSFASSCQRIFEEGQRAVQKAQEEQEAQGKRQEQEKEEAVAACARVEPMQNELQIEPVNPYGGISITDKDYEALLRIVEAEAGGEDPQGRTLVAEVILNRVLAEQFASSVYDVVFERTGGSPQFAPTADGRYYTVEVMPETVKAVEQAIHGEDVSQGALFFSARSKAEKNDMAWFDRNLKWLFQYGGHEFYTLP